MRILNWKRSIGFCLVWIVLLKCDPLYAQSDYTEDYRPQYHASPSNGFMGDPNGPIKYNGQYHLFWWGHLVSDDMVHWKEVNQNALLGTPSGAGNWSGSVVMDLNNTSGFGSTENPAMVAVYTLHENATGIQHQAISPSTNYETFNYYEGNPVIESSEPDFRDPQVFWHEQSSQWIMVITKPVDRAIRIYSSSDLKAWQLESTFDAHGAKKEVWEVPDLFQLPVNGDQTNQKWVMTCGMGPNRMQYWVGDFDGSHFTLDPNENLLTGKQVPGVVFEDFESDFSAWQMEGTAFGSGPTTSDLVDQMPISGYSGASIANSFHGGDQSTGSMLSESFVVSDPYINLLIGGGSGDGLRVELWVDGSRVSSIKAEVDGEQLRWRAWEVSEWIGQNAQFKVIDEATGGWGHILVDQIVFSSKPYDTQMENANWADMGTDFYAGKTFRNYDGDDNRKIWLAWMGNWAYAKDVPTSPWMGCESIPRSLSLNYSEQKGYTLVQRPIEELKTLRQELIDEGVYTISAGTEHSFSYLPEWNVYEMKVAVQITDQDQEFGIRLAEGSYQSVVISYDANRSELYLYRPARDFHYDNRLESRTPIDLPEDGILDLHIFVDQSSVEVLANDYSVSLTTLLFNKISDTGISFFSNHSDSQVLESKLWPLHSIWGVQAEELLPPLTVEDKKIVNCFHIYPNPTNERIYLPNDLGQGHVNIYSLDGRLRLHQNYLPGQDSVNVGHLDNGVYLLVYSDSTKRLTTQLRISK